MQIPNLLNVRPKTEHHTEMGSKYRGLINLFDSSGFSAVQAKTDQMVNDNHGEVEHLLRLGMRIPQRKITLTVEQVNRALALSISIWDQMKDVRVIQGRGYLYDQAMQLLAEGKLAEATTILDELRIQKEQN